MAWSKFLEESYFTQVHKLVALRFKGKQEVVMEYIGAGPWRGTICNRIPLHLHHYVRAFKVTGPEVSS